MKDIKEIALEIKELLKECGSIMLNADRSSIKIDAKSGNKNFVTEYDKKVQIKLKEGLANIFEEASFVGEEDEIHTFTDKGYAFIVDPIDGTTNFIKDYKMSCISVGLVKDGSPLAGVIYNPYLDEMYSAIKGEGAYLNNKMIHVSENPIDDALVVFGTAPYYDDLCKKAFEMAYEHLKRCVDVRRSGSAALDLCAVAAGRADIYFEPLICPWDIAAGVLIVEEAGGKVTTIEGDSISLNRKCSIYASNGVAFL